MTTTNLLDPMPGMEVLEHRLDLGRPELRELMNRYSCATPRASTTLLGPPAALIVVEPPRRGNSGRRGPGERRLARQIVRGPRQGQLPGDARRALPAARVGQQRIRLDVAELPT